MIGDLKIFLMAVLRLNDGKHFVTSDAPDPSKYGFVGESGALNFSMEQCRTIKKVFEPLYANHLQFMGKIIEAQKEQKIIYAELQARENKFQISHKTEQLAEKHRQKAQQPAVHTEEWRQEQALL